MAPAPTGASRSRTVPKPSKVRYFKGKAPNTAIDSDSDSDGEEVAPEPVKVDKSLVAGGAGRIIQQDVVVPKMKVELKDVKVEGGRFVVGGKVGQSMKREEEDDEDEEDDEAEAIMPFVPKLPKSEESSEYETDSEEESEDDKKPAFRPVFIAKGKRGMTQEKAAAEVEEAQRQEEEMREQRKNDSKDLAGETIRRELAEKEATEIQPDIDDTDGLDPDVEFDQWRARELARLLRDKEAQAAADIEREEIERRRAMPEEQRMREDMEYADGTRAKEKGQMGFLQKYYHKGAFHQDDDLLARDYTGATENDIDMSMLPKVMQVRDFGKMSRSKYTHLADQDTSQGGWGAANPLGPGGPSAPGTIGTTTTGCWNCGGPHMRKDCPNNNVNEGGGFGGFGQGQGQGQGYGGGGGGGGGYAGGAGAGGGGFGTSANNSALGQGSKSWGGGGGAAREAGNGRDGGRDSYRTEGKERRFDEERRNGNGGDSYVGGDGGGRGDRGGDRERGGNRERDRGDRERGGDRHRDGGERDRDGDRDRYRGRDDRKRSRSPDGRKDDRRRDDERRRDRDRDGDRRR